MRNKAWQQLIRFGFRLLYNELAWSYDAVSWMVSLGQWRAWQFAALPFLTGRRVLELGHGPGHVLLALAKPGYHVVGVDLSPFMGGIARRRLQRAGYRPILVQADVAHLPFQTAFDSILATFPTNFILQPETLAVVHRSLKPGGRLVIIPEAKLSGRGCLSRFIEWLYAITGQRSAIRSEENVRRDDFSRAEVAPYFKLMSALRQAGFSPAIHAVSLCNSTVTIIVGESDGEPTVFQSSLPSC
jgi:ubiquinone/menaquinone biosynthesis C-methylase UbiE